MPPVLPSALAQYKIIVKMDLILVIIKTKVIGDQIHALESS